MPRRWLRRLFVLLTAWIAVHLAVISVDGCRDDAVPADVAVVLGNAVTVGGQTSPRLQARLDRAIELHRAGLVPRIIVSGGQDPGKPHEADVRPAKLQVFTRTCSRTTARPIRSSPVLRDSPRHATTPP